MKKSGDNFTLSFQIKEDIAIIDCKRYIPYFQG